MSNIYRLLVGILCVWRVSHLVQAEDGPGDVIVHVRRAAGDSVFGQLIDCFYCLSLWVALPFACVIGRTAKERSLLTLAFSAGAILTELSTHNPAIGQSVIAAQSTFKEDEED